MVRSMLVALRETRLIEALVLLLPTLLLPIVLILERWAVSKISFSSLGLAVFRLTYLAAVIFALYWTCALASQSRSLGMAN